MGTIRIQRGGLVQKAAARGCGQAVGSAGGREGGRSGDISPCHHLGEASGSFLLPAPLRASSHVQPPVSPGCPCPEVTPNSLSEGARSWHNHPNPPLAVLEKESHLQALVSSPEALGAGF